MSHLTHDELMERNPLKLLLGRARTVVVYAPISYRHTAWRNHYFNILLAIFRQKIDILDNAKEIGYLVGNILHEFLCVTHTDNILIVVDTYIYATTLCVCETANPLQVLVVPRLFVFYILAFTQHFVCNLMIYFRAQRL